MSPPFPDSLGTAALSKKAAPFWSRPLPQDAGHAPPDTSPRPAAPLFCDGGERLAVPLHGLSQQIAPENRPRVARALVVKGMGRV
jgi:hypothetical protein